MTSGPGHSAEIPPSVPAPASAAPLQTPRLAALDAVRGLAVLGAALIHALIATDVWNSVPQTWWKGLLNIGFRSFTPAFFLVFGIMLELVYVRQAETGTPFAGRLLWRAWLCWLGFAAGAVTAAIFGHLSVYQLATALLMVGDAPWTSVLRFYSIVLVLVIGLVGLRLRWGTAVPWVLLATIWLLSPLVAIVPWPLSGPGEPLRFLWGSTFGNPPIWVGGSVWHNLTLVAMGMILGCGFRERLRQGLSPFPMRLAFLLAAGCLLVTGVCAMFQDPVVLLRSYAGDRMALRSGHHPVYYAVGGFSALLLLGMMFRLVRRDGGFLGEVGRRSLVVFSVSGVLLNMVPVGLTCGLRYGALLTFLQMAVLVGLVAALRWRDRVRS